MGAQKLHLKKHFHCFSVVRRSPRKQYVPKRRLAPIDEPERTEEEDTEDTEVSPERSHSPSPRSPSPPPAEPKGKKGKGNGKSSDKHHSPETSDGNAVRVGCISSRESRESATNVCSFREWRPCLRGAFVTEGLSYPPLTFLHSGTRIQMCVASGSGDPALEEPL